MRRRALTALATAAALSSAVCAGVGAGACADTEDGPPAAPGDDGGTLPPPADAAEGGSDGGDAKAPLATCTDDGFCLTELPPVHPWGLAGLRITDIAMDGLGGTWATTTSSALDDETAVTSHLLEYASGSWQLRFGVGPLRSEPFPFALRAIAANDEGTFLAVGGGPPEAPPRAVVLRVERGEVTVEYPPDLRAFVAVAFTSPTTAWVLDDAGALYRSELSDGPLVWTRQAVPHPADPDIFVEGPRTLFPGQDGHLFVAGQMPRVYTENGFIPGYVYLDKRAPLSDGGAKWTSSYVQMELRALLGVAIAPSDVWLAVRGDYYGPKGYFVGSTADDAGVNDGLAWPRLSIELPVEPQALWARAATDIWAVGAVGRVYHYDGTAWADAKLVLNGAPVTTSPLFAVTGLSSGEMWIGGQDVALHRASGKGGQP